MKHMRGLVKPENTEHSTTARGLRISMKEATHDRVLIYPTQKILDWLFDNKDINSFEVKCKFYVAVTRAKNSVAIVCKNDVNTEVLPIYQSNI